MFRQSIKYCKMAIKADKSSARAYLIQGEFWRPVRPRRKYKIFSCIGQRNMCAIALSGDSWLDLKRQNQAVTAWRDGLAAGRLLPLNFA